MSSGRQQAGRPAGAAAAGPFQLEDEADLLGLGQPPPAPANAAAATAAAAAAGRSGMLAPSSSTAASLLPAPSAPAVAANPAVLSLRNSVHVNGTTAYRSGSLGYGDLIMLDDDPMEHPMEAPEGADATKILAAKEAARGRARRKGAQEVVGVHGGEKHVPEDERTRSVQIQTLGGEGVLTGWQRLLKAAGVRRRPPGAFVSNELVTSKYNLLSFLPVNLYQQFKRVANMYFLALVVLQAIPGLSPVPWWGTLFPLAVVLTVNGVKEAFDDFWRHKSDELVNHRFVTTLKEDGDQRIYWKTLQVGDLVRLSNNEDIPADMVLLASSDPDGLCYVETANLDGETNLKVKFCHQATSSYDCAEAFSRAGYFTIECEAPNPRLYSFEGAICCWDIPPTHNPHPNLGRGLRGQGSLNRMGQGVNTRKPSRHRQSPEVELTEGTAAAAAGGAGGQPGSGWYASEHTEQEQPQTLRKGGSSPRRRAKSPSRKRQSDAGVDSVTAALGDYGQKVGLVYREPLSANNLLLRGCTLRKTEWVIGAVIFTGPDTKVVRNMLPAPRKVTRLETAMNRVVVAVLIILGTISVCLATANMVWEVQHKPARDWYLGQQSGWPELSPGIVSWLVQFVRFIILLAQAVPISLYVSLETVKVAQCKLLYDRDRLMYYAPEDVPTTSRTTTLNEELGQVQYVLSDKTGTLTQNIMGFVWASVGGKLYGHTQHAQQAAEQAAAATAAAAAKQAQARLGNSSTNSSNSNLLGTGGAPGKPAATGAGSAGGVVIAAGDDALPPPNTPHTIALDADMRAAAAAAAAADGSGKALESRSNDAAAVGEFLLALALCNTVVPTVTEAGHLLYQAASPDEEALVAGAAYLGTKLISRSAAGIEVEVNGVLLRYELLAVLEFSSDRKRMSVVVRAPDGRLQLIIKGADNVMLARLAGADLPPEQQALQQPLLAATTAHLSDMSNAGYRTLVVACKDLNEQQYEDWAEQYKQACASLTDRAGQVAAVCEQMEQGLTLLGATAVEDKLQDGVPQAIAALIAAGINVWVLTGDKMETAISIGHTARLLNQHIAVLKITEADLFSPSSGLAYQTSEAAEAAAAAVAATGQLQQQPSAAGNTASRSSSLWPFTRRTSDAASPGAGGFLDSNLIQGPAGVIGFSSGSPGGPASLALRRMRATVQALKAGIGQARGQAPPVSGQVLTRDHSLTMPAAGVAVAGVGVVIDGAALAVALQPQHEDDLLALCKECNAVICCRVSPMQKAQVATLLKHKAGAVTLAIGDGANDVSMIQAAHIGVGISGREGRAAVQAADFAFGQFRFLVRLLLVHGRQSYLRCREVVLYAFYKNVAYVSCYIFYSFYSGYSAQTIFFPLYIATFNSIWAAFPTLGYGIMEQDVPAEVAMANPQLYDETRCQTDSDFYQAWMLWVFIGLWHGFCCFYLPVYVLAGDAAISKYGLHVTVEEVGTAIMTAILITVTLRVAIRTTHWTVLNHALIWGTLALWLPFLGVLQGLCGKVPGLAPLCGVGQELLGSSGFWLAAVIGAPCAALLADYTIMVFQRALKPRASQLLQEAEALRKRGLRLSLAPSVIPGAAAATGQAPSSIQLQTHGPDVEQQYRQQQQQGASAAAAPAAAAAAARPERLGTAGAGIINVMPGSSSASISASSSMNLLGAGGTAAAGLPDQHGGWGATGYAAAAGNFAGIGADYNLGGPHTLGDMAAIEWAPNYITASPETLAVSNTKKQLRAPLSRISSQAPVPGSTGGYARRTISTDSDGGAFGPAVMQRSRSAMPAAAGVSTMPSIQQQQQQQQRGLVLSRMGQQQQQQRRRPSMPVTTGGSHFTLGGDDTL